MPVYLPECALKYDQGVPSLLTYVNLNRIPGCRKMSTKLCVCATDATLYWYADSDLYLNRIIACQIDRVDI